MSAVAQPAAPPTVFIVDDDDAVRDSLAVLLESEGLRTECFSSPVEFLDSGAAARPGCLLTDVRMPEMTGLDLQERLVSEGRCLPVIVITGHADVPLAVRAMKAGAHDFVEKPFDDEALIASVRTALARTVPVPAAAPAAASTRAAPPPAPEGPPPEIAGRLALLTPRERDVLGLLVEGKSNKVIAHELSISPRTVEIHRARVMEKMQADSLPALVRMALAAGPSATSS
ncbi:response regulator transcription factor [Azospirillum thermophilum]|uniref:DNA-binding response regulator n=1 Tax=Azospirillum thermophilum TaxID=2202148 RepID=A0A2S2CUN2_9PROT|nr:response regulator [Azospirillum thermophilum]AWK88179.1 DNA-binding response regulator [Azospirillum thermophilum]